MPRDPDDISKDDAEKKQERLLGGRSLRSIVWEGLLKNEIIDQLPSFEERYRPHEVDEDTPIRGYDIHEWKKWHDHPFVVDETTQVAPLTKENIMQGHMPVMGSHKNVMSETLKVHPDQLLWKDEYLLVPIFDQPSQDGMQGQTRTWNNIYVGRRIPVKEPSSRVVYVEERDVSRMQMMLHTTPDGRFYVKDMGSSFGTYLNDRLIGSVHEKDEPRRLHRVDLSDQIRLGAKLTLIFTGIYNNPFENPDQRREVGVFWRVQ